MDVRELARAQMVLAILVNAQEPHTWALELAGQVVPVQPQSSEGCEVRFGGHVALPEPWGGYVGLLMDGDLVWSFPELYFPPGECDVAFALGTRLDPVG
jgi:hypothetical protein